MNLRKTITGAAVALGGAAVMLGLGGTAQAAEIGAEARPQLDTEPGKIATIGDITRIDTENLADGIRTVDLDVTDPESAVESLAGSARDTLQDKSGELPTVETGVSLGS
ncbi:hypothetical protein F4560_006623 [Saccharothrix ecbatanensis]|jgi:hypothetical protein|uniref:Secreted protein n=1 Tax=Saccharothrix ecbatanensis TaxID=1105145 RepID=A0A7W9HRB4_9PSEU|nr:hypothetical protein [Saccharothrix ecbatanensis]MBB5806855.1 hypothetical protein [Saccharothrix ecbatanensis]